MDGFVSINAPQVFNVASVEELPTFTTVPLLVPSAQACPTPVRRNTTATCPGGGGGKDGSCTTCVYELHTPLCNTSRSFEEVPCSADADCARAVGQPAKGLTCSGLPVGCRAGICRSSDAAGNVLCHRGAGDVPAALDGGLVLQINVETGVGGALYAKLLGAGQGQGQGQGGLQAPPAGFALAVRGNFVSKTIRWSGGTSLSKLAGSTVALRVCVHVTAPPPPPPPPSCFRRHGCAAAAPACNGGWRLACKVGWRLVSRLLRLRLHPRDASSPSRANMCLNEQVHDRRQALLGHLPLRRRVIVYSTVGSRTQES